MPRPTVALAWGSMSMSRAGYPASATQAARLTAVVVLPTPPFWLAIAKTVPIDCVLTVLVGAVGTCCGVGVRAVVYRGRFRAMPGRLGNPRGVSVTFEYT